MSAQDTGLRETSNQHEIMVLEKQTSMPGPLYLLSQVSQAAGPQSDCLAHYSLLSPWGHDPSLGLGLTASSSAQHGPHTASGPEYGLSLDKSLTVSGFKQQARDFWCLSHL